MHFLIVEDHPLVREWLKTVLLESFRGSKVVEAETADQAMAYLPKGRWTAIMLDIELPDRSGLDLLRDFRDQAAASPVLVFSGRPEAEAGRRALQAGAAGFLSKASSVREVRMAIDRILAGRKYVSSDLAASIMSRDLTPGDGLPHQALSARELEVLRLLGTGCTPTEIGERLRISVKTVSTYRTRILEKLEIENTAGLIRYAVTHKLVD